MRNAIQRKNESRSEYQLKRAALANKVGMPPRVSSKEQIKAEASSQLAILRQRKKETEIDYGPSNKDPRTPEAPR